MFKDRSEAGRLLGHALVKYKGQKNCIVLGLARGGVEVAYEAAKELSLPLNVIVPRKVGAPFNSELGIGAVMENGEGFWNDSLIRALKVPASYIEMEVEKEKIRAQQRGLLYRKYAPLPELKGWKVILVDDGIATGASMFASIKAMRAEGASRIIAAVPVGATDTLFRIEEASDETVCLLSREDFGAVGYYYADFSQTSDSDVIELLKKAKEEEKKP